MIQSVSIVIFTYCLTISLQTYAFSNFWDSKEYQYVVDGDLYCFSDTKKDLPISLLNLVGELRSSKDKKILSHFQSYTQHIKDPLDDLDRSSSYFRRIHSSRNPNYFHNQEKLSKYSGAEEKNLAFFKDEDTNLFFQSLFFSIENSAVAWNPTKLNRADLFHAHLIFDSLSSDLLLIFHAKEYPNSLLNFSPAKFQLLRFLKETLPESIDMMNPTPAFTRRNFVWSLTHRCICGIDTSTVRFAYLRDPAADPSTLDPLQFTDLKEQGEIANLHFFPNESPLLFLDLLREAPPKS